MNTPVTSYPISRLPEIPTDSASTNPLLRGHQSGLPTWPEMTERHAFFGLGKALLLYESAVMQLEVDDDDAFNDTNIDKRMP